jgi:5'-deoxynucleotidase YfbR-like HD superfamily hydrolase
MKIFLSYSKADVKAVKRVRDDLRTHGHQPWFADDDIRCGESIPEKLSQGLDKADIAIVFLSKHSVINHWVKNEWMIKFFEQVNKGGVYIFPLLLEACEVPRLLQDKKLIDFTDNSAYETNLSILLRELQQIKLVREKSHSNREAESILDYTKELLDELEQEFIALPVHKRLPIVETLKKIPRSGKSVRLENFYPSLKIRSVYDHVISVGHLADCLLPYIQHNLSIRENTELARVIAFHELNEVILGDVPTYTSLSDRKRNYSRVYAERRLRSVTPERREQIADDLIWLFLSEKQRQSLEAVQHHLKEKTSPITIVFKMFDKLDPIIAVWRYLHHYKGQLGDSLWDFLRKMKDFFENPDILSYAAANRFTHEFRDLIDRLQKRDCAAAYYTDPEPFLDDRQLFSISPAVVKHIIEGCPLFLT